MALAATTLAASCILKIIAQLESVPVKKKNTRLGYEIQQQTFLNIRSTALMFRDERKLPAGNSVE